MISQSTTSTRPPSEAHAALNGVLIIDKPKGWTSHDVIAKLRKLSNFKRIGHSGTLDPMATGVLPSFFGPAGRLIEYMPDDKRYEALITFGSATTTWDAEGEVTETASTAALTLEKITNALAAFQGEIQQTVPPHSAVRVNGKKLYKYAQQGQSVELPVRTAQIFEINLLEFNTATHTLKLEIHCGSGTYIRSIAHELGLALGTYAHLSGLIRTAHGAFNLSQAITLEALEALPLAQWPFKQPANYIVLPEIPATAEQAQLIKHGIKLQPEQLPQAVIKRNQRYKLMLENTLVAICVGDEDGRLKPKKVFA